MDPSTVSAQGANDAQSMASRLQQQPGLAGQPGSLSQTHTAPVIQSEPVKQPISVHPEQEAPSKTAASGDQEDTIQPARQEVSTKSIAQQSSEMQEIEVKPTLPELTVEKSIERVVEKSADVDKPNLSEAVKAVGVTHSGPGIPIEENTFNIKTMPETYEQAVTDLKQHPKLNDSKHWLSELIMYVWRKMDPTYGKTKGGMIQ